VGVSVTAISHLSRKAREMLNLIQTNQLRKSEAEKFTHDIEETVGIVETNLQKASELISSFKRVSVDLSNEESRKFKVKEYIEVILRSLKPNLKKANVVITVVCDDALEILSYPGAFSQIITNFLMNSIIHGFDKSKEGAIVIDVSGTRNGIILTYSDDGKGIDKECEEFETTMNEKNVQTKYIKLNNFNQVDSPAINLMHLTRLFRVLNIFRKRKEDFFCKNIL